MTGVTEVVRCAKRVCLHGRFTLLALLAWLPPRMQHALQWVLLLRPGEREAFDEPMGEMPMAPMEVFQVSGVIGCEHVSITLIALGCRAAIGGGVTALCSMLAPHSVEPRSILHTVYACKLDQLHTCDWRHCRWGHRHQLAMLTVLTGRQHAMHARCYSAVLVTSITSGAGETPG